MRLFVDNFSNIDFSYLHPTRGLVGETWLVDIELQGALDAQGMVCDFGEVKRLVRNWLDQQIDHRLLIPVISPCLDFENHEEDIEFTWAFDGEKLLGKMPAQGLAFIDAAQISPETVSAWCIKELMSLFPPSIKSILLNFYPESIDGPFYHYSHGLKKHRGNCQRIAHGHRSKILIWRDHELDESQMEAWSYRFRDIYIATREDCVEAHIINNLAFQYQSQQGSFYLELPKKCCYLIETDTTIEFIAQHIAQELKRTFNKSGFKVKAFEGLNKGAIALI